MKYFYYFLAFLITLATLYSVAGIGYFKWLYYKTENPKAGFQVLDNNLNEITIVDFTNYRCGFCKAMHPIIKEAMGLEKNIRYIPRPILFKDIPEEEEKQEPVELEKLVMAAGMQGKFKEMHNFFMEHPNGIIPEEEIKETAELYDINYDQLVKDSQSKQVQEYLENNLNDMLATTIETMPSYIVGKNIYIISEKLPTLQEFLTMVINEKKAK